MYLGGLATPRPTLSDIGHGGRAIFFVFQHEVEQTRVISAHQGARFQEPGTTVSEGSGVARARDQTLEEDGRVRVCVARDPPPASSPALQSPHVISRYMALASRLTQHPPSQPSFPWSASFSPVSGTLLMKKTVWRRRGGDHGGGRADPETFSNPEEEMSERVCGLAADGR